MVGDHVLSIALAVPGQPDPGSCAEEDKAAAVQLEGGTTARTKDPRSLRDA